MRDQTEIVQFLNMLVEIRDDPQKFGWDGDSTQIKKVLDIQINALRWVVEDEEDLIYPLEVV